LIATEWNRQTTEVIEDLIYRIPEKVPKRVEFNDFDKLPKCVAKYLNLVLQKGGPIIEAVRLTQSGKFRAGGWTPFKAEQYFSTAPVAFVWNAKVRMAHLIPVKVRDAYREGKGSMVGKMFGTVPLVDQRNAQEINIASLQRYLAECPWFPTALLPSDRLRWSEIDSNRAMAKIKDRDLEVALEFQFNEIGEIVTVSTPGRFRYTNGKFLSTPWAGHFQDYQEVHGVRIPMKARVEWIFPEGPFPYFEGEVTKIDFNGDVFRRFALTQACEVC
jgi:hypothetical protein